MSQTSPREKSPHKAREDRRVRITKQAIRESFVELMGRYPISKISVKMISESADINRSTFYAHYADQYDLLHQIQKETISDIRAYIADKTFTKGSQITTPILAQVLEYARDNAAVFIVLLNDNSDMTFKNDLMLVAHDQALKEIRADANLDPQTSKYLQHFAIDGLMSIIQTWLEDDAPEEPEQLAEIVTRILFQGMSAFYR